jgi:hypothetical protein
MASFIAKAGRLSGKLLSIGRTGSRNVSERSQNAARPAF